MAAPEDSFDDYQVITKDTANLWDQFFHMMKIEKWTTQDYASVSLLREMPNVHYFFLVRKSDNYLVGGAVFIEHESLIHANVALMRKDYRQTRHITLLVSAFLKFLKPMIMSKVCIGRGTIEMIPKYRGPPYYSELSYTLYSFHLDSKHAVEKFFPLPGYERRVVALKNLTNKQYQQFLDYDKYVTGVDRTKFLKAYYSISFVEGFVMFDNKGSIIGFVGSVPTLGGSHMYKLNPIFAQSFNDACILVKTLLDVNVDPEAEYVIHVRSQSAGDFILRKCLDELIEVKLIGILCNATVNNLVYKDPSRTELMFAPTNSPAHFDG